MASESSRLFTIVSGYINFHPQIQNAEADIFATTPIDERAVEASPLYHLPDELLLKIFKKTISKPQDAAALSLVCKKFKSFSNSDKIWQRLSHEMEYKKNNAISWKDSYYNSSLGDKTKELFEKLSNPDLMTTDYHLSLGLIELLKCQCGPTVKDPEDSRKFIEQLIDNIKFDYYKKVLTQIEYIKTCPTEREIQKAKDIIERQIEDPYFKALAQIKLIRVLPSSKDGIKIAEDLIEQIKNPYFRVLAQIKLLKIDPTENKITIALSTIAQMNFLQSKYLPISKLIKTLLFLYKNNDAKHLINQISDLDLIAIANIFLLKTKKTTEEDLLNVKNTIKQVKDPLIKALAQVELIKVSPNEDSIKTAMELIELIPHDYQKNEAKMQLIRALLKLNMIKKAECLIETLTNKYEQGDARIRLLKTLMRNCRVQNAFKRLYQPTAIDPDIEQKLKFQLKQLGSCLGRPNVDNLASTPYPLAYTTYYLSLGLMELYKHKIGTTKKDIIVIANQFLSIDKLYNLDISLDSSDFVNAIYGVIGALYDIAKMATRTTNFTNLIQAVTQAFIDYIKIYPDENSQEKEAIIKRVKNLIEHSMRRPYHKALAQIKFLQAMPSSEDEIKKAKSYINQIENLTPKVSAQIKLLKVLYTNEEEKTANHLLEQMEDSHRKEHNLNLKALLQTKLMKIYLRNNDNEKAKNLLKQIKHPDFNALAQVMLLKIDSTKKAIIKTTTEKINDPYLKALAQIEFLNVDDPTEDSMKIADDLIEDISDRIDKEKAKMKLIKAYLLLNKFEKAEDLITRVRSPQDQNHARIWFLKALVKNYKNY